MPNIQFTSEGPVGLITINRPDVLNALNPETLEELGRQLDAIPEGIRCLILTGAGRAFIAGADIAAMRTITPLEAHRFAELGQNVTRKIEALPQPVIAAVNGFALGGGCEMALACDFIVASEKAKFGQPEVKLGIIPGFGGSQRLIRAVGPGWARRMICSAEMIDAETAARLGLATEVVPADKLMDRVRELATMIAANGPHGVGLSKRAINAGGELDINRGLQMEADLFGVVFSTEDRVEGVSAFLDKRPAQFKGR